MNAGDRVKFLRIFDLAPDPVYDKVGEVGTTKDCTTIKKNEKSLNVWLVIFDDGIRIWINEKDLEVVSV